jgi:conjugative transfer pilus assembly protein TraH
MSNKFRLAFLCFALLFSYLGNAGIQQEMDGWVDQLSDPSHGLLGNATAPQAVSAAGRGVVFGGSISVRSGIKDVSLYNIDPPSIRAGCGGIDMYGGSFSLISKDEFVALLRAIGQNAVGYAFQLALQSYCPLCMQTMSEFAAKLNELQAGLQNSCKSAEWLVNNTGIKELVTKAEAETGTVAVTSGGAQDAQETNLSVGGSSPTQMAKSTNPNAVLQIYGNVVWRALHKSGFDAAYVAGDNELKRVVMSLIGTVITEEALDADENLPISEGEIWAPTLSVKEFLEGSEASGNEIKIYSCSGKFGADECKEKALETVVLKGMKQRIREIMIGPGVGVGGIVGKWVANSGTYTAAESSFIAISQAPAAMLQRISRIDGDLARQYADEIAGDLSYVFVESFIRKALIQVRQAITQSDHSGAPMMLEMVDARTIDLGNQLAVAKEKYQNSLSDILEKGSLYLEQRDFAPDIEKGTATSNSN